jgi:hypothetical protein
VQDFDALLVPRTGEKQRRDELRGRRGVDLDLAAGHRSRTPNRERQPPAAGVVDDHPGLSQRVK